jgi:hypothetical protein
VATPDPRHNERYGWPHRRARAAALANLRANPGQPCARCGRPLTADMAVHLDHAPAGGYLGLSCARCNTRAGGKVGNAVR